MELFISTLFLRTINKFQIPVPKWEKTKKREKNYELQNGAIRGLQIGVGIWDYKSGQEVLQIGAVLVISDRGKRLQIEAEITNRGKRDFRLGQRAIEASYKLVQNIITSFIEHQNRWKLSNWHLFILHLHYSRSYYTYIYISFHHIGKFSTFVFSKSFVHVMSCHLQRNFLPYITKKW